MKPQPAYLAIFLVTCAQPAPVPTRPVPDITQTPDAPPPAGPPEACERACDRMAQLGCPGWAPRHSTCVAGCAQAVESIGHQVDLPCIAGAADCTAAENCLL